jgi:hypothetical protein
MINGIQNKKTNEIQVPTGTDESSKLKCRWIKPDMEKYKGYKKF